MGCKRSIILVLIFIVGCHVTYGQTNYIITLKDEINNQSIEGVAVSFSKADQPKVLKVSDNKGRVEVPYTAPFTYTVQHVSFVPFSDTVTTNGNISKLLRASDTYLSDVVVTGQYQPQSAKNSVYRITSLDSKRIADQGAVSLQDVLSNALNVRFSRDNATGVAGVSLQGIAGQNVKVLMDGVPIVGRSGTQNEVDLNQINISDIQRVEIVEGPMAVNYGSDALAGVINIITKKDSDGRLNLNVGLHEETVGDEYSLFSEGIHAPSVSVGYKPMSNWYTQIGVRLNRFGGWQGNQAGRNKEWYPKTQYFGDGLVRYEKGDFSIYYKLSYLNELLENLGPANDNNPLKDPTAIDEEYQANRIMHQLQSDWSLGKSKSHTVLSYTDYERTSRQFNKNLITGAEQNTIDSEQDTALYQSLFFRNTTTGLLSGENINTQLGVEATFETAGGTTLSDGDKHLTDVAASISAELSVGSKLKIRPGIRASYNSIFTTTPMPSVNLKYKLAKSTQLRVGYGRGFRAPSIRELYHEFIDANHNIIGNEELDPERSHNFNGDLSHTLASLPLQVSIGGFYNYIDNRIALFTTTSNQATTYTNLLKYKTTGGIFRLTYNRKRLQVAGGFTYTGIYQRLNESFDVPQFVYSPEVNTNLKYSWPKIRLQFNVFYKYTGERKSYALATDENTGEQTPFLTETESFQLLDITLNKSFGQHLSVGLGVRNLLDVTYLNSTESGGAHSQSSAGVGYGRSYFIKMNFQLVKQ